MATIYCAYEDYYGLHQVRSLAMGMKRNDRFAIHRISKDLVQFISKDCMLVPIPNRSGFAENTLLLAEMIRKLRPLHVRVADVLKGVERGSLYDSKKNHEARDESYFGFHLTGGVPDHKNIMLLDNVLATGLTASAALKLLPGADVLVHSVAPDAFKQSAHRHNFEAVIAAAQTPFQERQRQRIRL